MNAEQSLRFLEELLRLMVSRQASDLFLTAGFPPAFKLDGAVTPAAAQPLAAAHTQALADAIFSPEQAQLFARTRECNFALARAGIGRFRVNVFMQQGAVGLVLRRINTEIPQFDSLNLPPVLRDVVMSARGLAIVVGGTGSGKSTTLAAMIDQRNSQTAGHILTIEDPVEFVHPHKRSIISQREIGMDTENWEAALKNALRQAPDVILIGEIRDRETMEYAVAFAETGHLCLATLHANSANQALDRIINFFPEERRQQLLMDLSLNLRGIISQRLVPLAAGKGRAAAIEILLNTPTVAEQIFRGNVGGLKEIMASSRESGMQTFDQALYDLLQAGQIRMEDALRFADSVNDLRLKIKLSGQDGQVDQLSKGLDHLDIV